MIYFEKEINKFIEYVKGNLSNGNICIGMLSKKGTNVTWDGNGLFNVGKSSFYMGAMCIGFGMSLFYFLIKLCFFMKIYLMEKIILEN